MIDRAPVRLVAEIAGVEAWLDLPASAIDTLRAVMAAVLRRLDLAGTFEVSVVLADDRRVQRANRRFRGIDRPTDILSFPLSAAPLVALAPGEGWTTLNPAAGTAPPLPIDPDAPYHLGDMIISMPAVARQAATAGHSAWWELCFLVAHGMLHLVGYDDEDERGYHAMMAHQEAVLAEVGISRS